MMLTIVPDDAEEATYRDLMSRGAVDGVIVQGMKTNDPRIRILRDIGMPFVVHGRATGVEADYNWVDVNNRRAFQRATRVPARPWPQAASRWSTARNSRISPLRRKAGMVDAMTERGLTPDPAMMYNGEMTEAAGLPRRRDGA